MLSAVPTLTAHHWAFDGLVPDVPTAPLLCDLLVELVGVIRMTPIGPPAVWVTAPDWMAFQLIGESHIALHGQGGRAWVDVFSCKSFEAGDVQDALYRALGGEWRATRVERQ